MEFYTTGGYHDYKEEGELSLFPFAVFYDGYSILNIIYLKDVANIFRITMDTKNDRATMVHANPHNILIFSECGNELCWNMSRK